MTHEKAYEILDHLWSTNQEFCFYQGVIITREDCNMIIDTFNTV